MTLSLSSGLTPESYDWTLGGFEEGAVWLLYVLCSFITSRAKAFGNRNFLPENEATESATLLLGLRDHYF